MGGMKMDKSIFASKTFWGFGVALAIAGLQAMGYIDPSVVSELLKYTGGIVGVWGVRAALPV